MIKRYDCDGYDSTMTETHDGFYIYFDEHEDIVYKLEEVITSKDQTIASLEQRLQFAYDAKCRSNDDANAERSKNKKLEEEIKNLTYERDYYRASFSSHCH
jgi:hypothetical protein